MAKKPVEYTLALPDDLGPAADRDAAFHAASELPIHIRVHGIRMLMYLAATFVDVTNDERQRSLASYANARQAYALYCSAILCDPKVGPIHEDADTMLSEAVSRCPDTMPLLAEFAEMADTFRDAIAEGKDDLSRELYRRAADFASGRPAEASTELSAAMRAVAAEFRASSVRSAQHAQARTQNGRSEITDIAKTIRLISLNARIEAARAGTAGRAFGVIAEEIKLLSDRTTMATDEVGRGIDAIMSQFHGAKETSLPASSHPRPTAGCGAAQDRQMGE